MSTGGLWFQWARTISIHYYLDIGLLTNNVSLWTSWWYGKFIWSKQSRLNDERCEFLQKIEIRNNEINARNLFLFLLIVLILLLLNLCLDMTDGLLAFWSILTNLLKKHHWCCEFEYQAGRCVQHYVIKFVSDLPPGWWFSPGTPMSSTTQPHDMTEILLKVVLVIYLNPCIRTKVII